jgi:glycosyltransferase domain-containing protein
VAQRLAQAQVLTAAKPMRDFTLIIPTFNRPQLLSSALAYLQAECAECRILVADSSREDARKSNRAVAARQKLDLEYLEFPVETHPFDKFREAVQMANTPFCALCADDDLVVLDGVRQCLDALRQNPKAAVAQGYSFSFQCQSDGSMELGAILYFTPTIDEVTPLARLANLFDCYQAATYGNYRTAVLQQIFDSLRPMKSILARELLGSALASIEGAMIRVPYFSHGRSMSPSENYEHWHPLEWFIRDAQSLFEEYHQYRELIAERVLQRADNDCDERAVRHILDLVHLRYFAKHAPEAALDFIIEQEMAGRQFAEYWQHKEIQQPLWEAAGLAMVQPGAPTGPTSRILPGLLTGEVRHPRSDQCRRLPGSVQRKRSFNLRPDFVAPASIAPPSGQAIDRLLDSLDNYQVVDDLNTATVSVLLCNYNHAQFLPESLDAICNQTRLPDELIVLDDGSTDQSLAVIENYAKQFPFIRVLKNDENRGLLYSINRALAATRCDLIVWAAADDRLLPMFLERNLECLRRYPSAAMTFSRLATFRFGSDEILTYTEKEHGDAFDFGDVPKYWSPSELRTRLQRSYLWLSANTVMARRSAVLAAGGFDPALRWHADYFTSWVVALRHGACSIPETLAAMRVREQTYSSSGMSNRSQQLATLGRMADKLTHKGIRDIGLAYLRCPALLSPFGALAINACWRSPRRWPFAVTYGLWWANYRYQHFPPKGVLSRRLSAIALRAANTVVRRSMAVARAVLNALRRVRR